ncbi:MAG: tryptophan-rich sensory protein [Coriobacteriia bacterium]|nr:tryptophan-rich sensory protein [Coriobacteriia bacterium]
MALRVLVALTVVGTIVMNVLANALPLFGRGTGEVSALYPTLVTPAGYVFAIWGLIYLGLLAYSAAQFVRPLADDPLPDRLAWPLLVSNLANVSWLLLWHSLNIYWTVPVMLVLLASLIAAYLVARRDRPDRPSGLERWAVRAPLGLYLGWISIATIANVSSALYATKWSGWGIPPERWGAIVLVVGAALAFAGLAREGDSVFAGVFVWAFAGIAGATPSELVRIAAAALAGSIAVGIVLSAVARRRLV